MGQTLTPRSAPACLPSAECGHWSTKAVSIRPPERGFDGALPHHGAPHQKGVTTLRFWTDDLAEGPDAVVQKHCWSSGQARLGVNPTHGIKATRTVPFDSFSKIASTIEDMFIDYGIKVHPSRRDQRYLARD
jgi:hypothetical protein